jgi:hypothetical protein
MLKRISEIKTGSAMQSVRQTKETAESSTVALVLLGPEDAPVLGSAEKKMLRQNSLSFGGFVDPSLGCDTVTDEDQTVFSGMVQALNAFSRAVFIYDGMMMHHRSGTYRDQIEPVTQGAK